MLLPQSISRQYPYRNISPAHVGVDPWILDVPLVHDLPLDVRADDAPPLEHPEAAPDRRETDSRRTDDGGRQVDGLPRLWRRVAAHVQHDGSGAATGGATAATRASFSSYAPSTWVTRQGSSPNHRTSVPSPPRLTTPIQPPVPGTHPKGTAL